MLSGVAEAIRVSKPYKLVGRDLKHDDTIVRVGDVEIGGAEPAIIAGPCAVESYEQTMEIAEMVASTGVKLFRGGAFKPRTSPYSFQGLGEEGLKILAAARDRFGLRIVTEVLDTETADLVEEYADIVQIGARNMQNFSLLRRVGQANKPVMLKRGMSATLDELLLAAEYIMAEGNYNVILCERGVRTFADHTRNTLDLSIVPAVQTRSHLPIIVDPSHGTGKRHKVSRSLGLRSPPAPMGLWSKCTITPSRRCLTARKRCCRICSDSLSTEVHAIHKVIAEQVDASRSCEVVNTIRQMEESRIKLYRGRDSGFQGSRPVCFCSNPRSRHITLFIPVLLR